jgi:hypothetical protein
VNALLLLVGAVLTADPLVVTQSTFFDADSYQQVVIRGQTGEPFAFADDSFLGGATSQLFGSGNSTAEPYDPGTAGAPSIDSGITGVPGLSFGISGPQPYRFGWTSRYDVGFLPSEGVSGSAASGSFSIFEFNSAWRYTTGTPGNFPNLIFSVTPEINYRSWTGPTNPGLPGSVFRFASDFELATPGNFPISMQLGFTPAFVSDLSASVNSDAFNYDVRGVVFLRASPQWMFALGAAYWQRVDGIVLPYAGVVWTPNDLWELRLMFPRTRVSYFLGNWWGAATWAYGSLEYAVEAYQIDLASPSGDPEKIQLSDYRALVGLRSEGGGVTGFIEGGLVLDRHVEFLHGTPGFNINTGFIARVGLRF